MNDAVPNADGMLLEVIHRLDGSAPAPSWQHVPPPASLSVPVQTLKSELMALAQLAPQPRGYAFERFLVSLKAYGLQPHGAFRLVGEQIDGSFKHDGEFYLLEAKWQDPKTPAADLHIFDGKLRQKAQWARGLLPEVLERKLRWAAERGELFRSVRDLF